MSLGEPRCGRACALRARAYRATERPSQRVWVINMLRSLVFRKPKPFMYFTLNITWILFPWVNSGPNPSKAEARCELPKPPTVHIFVRCSRTLMYGIWMEKAWLTTQKSRVQRMIDWWTISLLFKCSWIGRGPECRPGQGRKVARLRQGKGRGQQRKLKVSGFRWRHRQALRELD